VEYSFLRADYDTFIINQSDGDECATTPPARADFHQIYVTIGLQYTPDAESVRYEQPLRREEPVLAPQPPPERRTPAAAPPKKSEDEVDI
jgi:hypothetical protein